MYRHFLKRPFDIILSFLALIVLFPTILLLAILVRIKLGSPIFFCQQRPGLHEKIFTLYKFRTMMDATDRNGNLLSDDLRLTPFGNFLRTTSLDELPELWNILKGDMSIVGPRPLLVKYLPLYDTSQRRRHEIRPGLSGLAQVCGRNTCSWEEKFHYDTYYVDHITFLTDCKIILHTIYKVLKREGINSSGTITMTEFTGTKGQVHV